VISVTRDRSGWGTVGRSAKSSTGESIVEEDLLQGVPRSRFRLSVEEGTKGNRRSKAQEGERWKIFKERSPWTLH
jgi:hypothetical protein